MYGKVKWMASSERANFLFLFKVILSPRESVAFPQHLIVGLSFLFQEIIFTKFP